ncbi:MAG: hypothetical protein FD149_530 [Rhodospirillaceae bacterium]|nr:MAG: hypothetical protein FD149_530 [Rhodospirillaceae bacterium]
MTLVSAFRRRYGRETQEGIFWKEAHMRIIGGALRGRRFMSVPEGVRPTADRTRQAIFNIMVHRFQGEDWTLDKARVLDVFAGTGAMGFEALSRGAAHVSFIDSSTAARAGITAHARAFNLTRQSTILAHDALRPPRTTLACTLAFLDPPYDSDDAAPALAALQVTGWLTPGALCVIEHRTLFVPPPGFRVADARVYGKTTVLFVWAPG